MVAILGDASWSLSVLEGQKNKTPSDPNRKQKILLELGLKKQSFNCSGAGVGRLLLLLLLALRVGQWLVSFDKNILGDSGESEAAFMCSTSAWTDSVDRRGAELQGTIDHSCFLLHFRLGKAEKRTRGFLSATFMNDSAWSRMFIVSPLFNEDAWQKGISSSVGIFKESEQILSPWIPGCYLIVLELTFSVATIRLFGQLFPVPSPSTFFLPFSLNAGLLAKAINRQSICSQNSSEFMCILIVPDECMETSVLQCPWAKKGWTGVCFHITDGHKRYLLVAGYGPNLQRSQLNSLFFLTPHPDQVPAFCWEQLVSVGVRGLCFWNVFCID